MFYVLYEFVVVFVSQNCCAPLKVLQAFDHIQLFLDFEVFIINRSEHKRTLEGGGEKPSRHEHEPALIILSFYF